MTAAERRALRERYQFRCGYCGVHENEVGAELTVDHFQPRSSGGTDQFRQADEIVGGHRQRELEAQTLGST